jgi:hypothetical protein
MQESRREKNKMIDAIAMAARHKLVSNNNKTQKVKTWRGGPFPREDP